MTMAIAVLFIFVTFAIGILGFVLIVAAVTRIASALRLATKNEERK